MCKRKMLRESMDTPAHGRGTGSGGDGGSGYDGNMITSTGNHYYSLDVGPVHLVAYNGEAFYWPEYFDVDYMARMYDWLENDLRAVRSVNLLVHRLTPHSTFVHHAFLLL